MLPFDRSWTLFLDRDGVINAEKVGSYIFTWSEFVFLPRVEEAIAMLSRIFGRLIVVTNQRGVGRGLMTEGDLETIHEKMRTHLMSLGGRIDAIYACTDIQEDSLCRKPNIGMALQAQKDFPEIDFTRSIMVGNSESDMEFGRRLGMRTVWITTKKPTPEPADLADEIHPSLWAWALTLGSR
ncbi:MAG: HAD family hydrolase [Bacteroidia bacterium]|nr:HAD family hydrolase [Bacteroidia bacterium]MCX7652905.1 HAD family hydrolase [Bacteroidia bacterium]MDW8416627.1 HAD family hydrolase [Bacteroidia bacterium]